MFCRHHDTWRLFSTPVLKFIVSLTIYSWIALNDFFNDSKPIWKQFVNRCLVLQKKNSLRMCEVTKSWPYFIHVMNSKLSTSLSPLSCKFAINFCRIHIRTGRCGARPVCFGCFLLQFLSRPLQRSDQTCFGDSAPQVSRRCISESRTEGTGVVVCVYWYSGSCWKDRKCAQCLFLDSTVLIFQQEPLHHLTSAPSLRNRNKPVRIQFIRLTFLAVGAVWWPLSTVWALRLLHAVFTTQEMLWLIIRGRINTYFEADTS